MRKKGSALTIVLIMMTALLILATTVSSGVINTMKFNKRYSDNLDLELDAKSALNIAREYLISEINKNKNNLKKVNINIPSSALMSLNAKVTITKLENIYTIKSEAPKEGTVKFTETQDIKVNLNGHFNDEDYIKGEPFDPSKDYKYGDFVELDGVIYMCKKYRSEEHKPNSYTSGQLDTWYAVSSENGATLKFNNRVMYMPGTIVEHYDKRYMLTPIDNNLNLRSDGGMPNGYQDINNESYWTEITKNSNLVKPPKYSQINDFEDFNTIKNNRDKFIAGQYYYYQNNLYECLNGQMATSYRWEPNNYDSIRYGYWKMVSPLYEYNSARYEENDEVWYRGYMYRAKKDMVTYKDGTHLRPSSKSEYWQLIE